MHIITLIVVNNNNNDTNANIPNTIRTAAGGNPDADIRQAVGSQLRGSQGTGEKAERAGYANGKQEEEKLTIT